MKNLDEIIKKTILNMKYDSKKTLFENKMFLWENTDKPLTFIAPNPKSPSTNIKIVTVGKSLSTVSSNLEKLKESKPLHDETTLVYFPSKKYIQYIEGSRIINYRESTAEECVLERYPNGTIKKQNQECAIKRSNRINQLEKERHAFCLSKITNNQTLMNMPFAIQVSSQKYSEDEFGVQTSLENGTYNVLFFLNGDNCDYAGFNYFLDSGYETSLNTDYPLKPMKAESISNTQNQKKPIIKKVTQNSKTPKLTPEEQKKWCKEHNKQWDEEMGVCLGAEVTVTPNDNTLTPTEKEVKNSKNQKQNKDNSKPELNTIVIDDF